MLKLKEAQCCWEPWLLWVVSWHPDHQGGRCALRVLGLGAAVMLVTG